MTQERVVVDLDDLQDDNDSQVGLTEDEIQQSIAEEQQNPANDTEAAEGEDAQDSSEPDIFQKAAESLTGDPVPDVVSRSDFETAFNDLKTTMMVEMQRIRDSKDEVRLEDDSVDEKAFERWLIDGVADADPEQVARSKAEFKAFKNRLAQESDTNDTIATKIASIEEKIDRLASQPQQNVQTWSETDANHIRNSITYLGAAHGLNLDFGNQTQMAAVLDGVVGGEDVQTAIQKINQNMNKVRNQNQDTEQTNTQQHDVANSTAANVPSLGGALTSQDSRVFNNIDDIRLAIANDEIDMADYSKYVAQL